MHIVFIMGHRRILFRILFVSVVLIGFATGSGAVDDRIAECGEAGDLDEECLAEQGLDVLLTEKQVTDDQYTLYEDDGEVLSCSTSTGLFWEESETVCMNVSIHLWTEGQARTAAVDTIEQELAEELGTLAGITVEKERNLADDTGVHATYHVYNETVIPELRREVTYDEFTDTVPDAVTATVHFTTYTGHTTIHVNTEQVPAPTVRERISDTLRPARLFIRDTGMKICRNIRATCRFVPFLDER